MPKRHESGCHVFMEKPVAETVKECHAVVETARRGGRKLVVGYICTCTRAGSEFVEISHGLGKPLVMRMNLNQQSYGANGETHQNLLRTCRPVVDCGVHYVDVMCRMTRAGRYGSAGSEQLVG